MKQLLTAVACVSAMTAFAQPSTIYKKGWIDFNKNGRKDIFEDPAQPVDKRVEDLLRSLAASIPL